MRALSVSPVPLPPQSPPPVLSVQQTTLQELVVASLTWEAQLLDLTQPEPAFLVEIQVEPSTPVGQAWFFTTSSWEMGQEGGLAYIQLSVLSRGSYTVDTPVWNGSEMGRLPRVWGKFLLLPFCLCFLSHKIFPPVKHEYC